MEHSPLEYSTPTSESSMPTILVPFDNFQERFFGTSGLITSNETLKLVSLSKEKDYLYYGFRIHHLTTFDHCNISSIIVKET